MRKDLWEGLVSIASSHNEPWLLAGDLNVITSPEEKSGGAFGSHSPFYLVEDIKVWNWLVRFSIGNADL